MASPPTESHQNAGGRARRRAPTAPAPGGRGAGGEGQPPLRGPARYVARLERVAPASEAAEEAPSVPAGSTPFQARASAIGTLDGLRLPPLRRRPPRAR